MNAKLGGIPWAVDKLPFMDKPTMICGLDVFHATNLGKKSVLALAASMNNSATTYWSTSVVQDDVVIPKYANRDGRPIEAVDDCFDRHDQCDNFVHHGEC